ncbi:MAG TPA: nucleotidyltransferase domain-containing protein [Desulfuromonadales bacterium]|nr:nucleotidyltransferase domain-containing protein [Desulfuromonadales bacterium]
MAAQMSGDFSGTNVIDQKFIDDVVERLVKIEPAKIILFGSYADGTAHADSDVDILVIKTSVGSKIKEMIAARKLLKGLKKPFDVIVTTIAEFEFYRNQVNSVHHAADKSGHLIYGR